MNNNIQESYCSFEVSKLLKEKGFDIIGQKWYSADKSIYYQDEFNNNRGHIPSLYCEAPTHALAIEWIRVNFGIWISVDFDTKYWFTIITNLSEKDEELNHEVRGDEHKIPQEATEAALLYTLQNLIP